MSASFDTSYFADASEHVMQQLDDLAISTTGACNICGISETSDIEFRLEGNDHMIKELGDLNRRHCMYCFPRCRSTIIGCS
jgi:hypothetical protein